MQPIIIIFFILAVLNGFGIVIMILRMHALFCIILFYFEYFFFFVAAARLLTVLWTFSMCSPIRDWWYFIASLEYQWYGLCSVQVVCLANIHGYVFITAPEAPLTLEV
jgi:hypothetical protein